MVCVNKEDMHKIAPLFDGWNETMIWSCLQGHMGKAWADDLQSPQSAQVITGDFCALAGVPNRELANNIPDTFSSPCIFMIPQNEQWHDLIEQTYKDNCEKFTRYATKKEPNVFDMEKLRIYSASLPAEYRIRNIDEEIYNCTKTQEWSIDLCSQFPTCHDYERRGIGFVIVHHDTIVCGASSYTVYDNGIEIEIDTKEEYRRKGLALACAARLILACLDRGLYPSWDAANKESLALAEKLGYHFDKEYPAYSITVCK